MLEIVYRDEYLIAVNKPHGLLVHRSPIAAEATEFALQILRDQIGQKVNPVHRIDRKTGGILLFALDKQVEIAMQQAFMDNKVKKNTWPLCAGIQLIPRILITRYGKRTELCRMHLPHTPRLNVPNLMCRLAHTPPPGTPW